MKIRGAALIAAAALALAGCGGGEPAESTTTQAPADYVDPDADVQQGEPAANPVPIARKIPDCILEPGAEVGERGIDGERTVTCHVMAEGETAPVEDGGSSTDVEVTTLPTPRPPGWADDDMEPDDSHKIVTGDGFVITITGRAGGAFDVTPKQVAEATGGEVLPAG